MSQAPLPQERFEALEAYVLGRLDAAERLRFEQELAADAGLRAELALQREHILAVEMAGVERQLNLLGSKQGGLRLHSINPGRRWLKVAAMVAVLVAGTWLWTTRPAAHERLYAEYHRPDPGLPVPMSATRDPQFQDAMVAYKLGDHAEAVAKWSILLQSEPGNDTLRYYIASAELAQGHAAAAISLLKGLAEDSVSAFQTKARWYLFLAYLHEGRIAELRAMDMGKDPVYGERARQVEQRLDH